MTARQVKKLMIYRSAKGAYTAPEIRFDEYQSSRKMNLIMDRTLPFTVSESMEQASHRASPGDTLAIIERMNQDSRGRCRSLGVATVNQARGIAGSLTADPLPTPCNEALPHAYTYNFQCDFLRQTATGSFDIDFEIDGEGHKEKWDHWKDGIKNESGLKVIHIPGEVTKKKWWCYLDEQIPKALLSQEKAAYIPG